MNHTITCHYDEHAMEFKKYLSDGSWRLRVKRSHRIMTTNMLWNLRNNFVTGDQSLDNSVLDQITLVRTDDREILEIIFEKKLSKDTGQLHSLYTYS